MNKEKPLIIFDTDMDTDCDDVGAFAMLMEAHRLNKIKLAGVISDSVSKYAAPCCEMIANYYGFNFPIGAIYSDNYKETENDIERFADYRRHSKNCLENGRSYNRIFADDIGKIDRDYSTAATTYRKLLSDADDNSVIIVCVGMLTAIQEALCTNTDEISVLSGVELFQKKVKYVITMGNPDKINDFNWGKDSYATKLFFSLCPVPVYISAEGTNVVTGNHLTAALSLEHPLRRAYEIWLGKENFGRSSWDLIAVLYAINSKSTYLICNDYGYFEYNAEKKQLFSSSKGAQCKKIYLNCEPHQMEVLLNQYMLGNFKNY